MTRDGATVAEDSAGRGGDTTTPVQQAHELVREKILTLDPDREYGFFLQSADDEWSGVWLEPDRRLEYYMLRDGDSLLYLPKHRNLRLRMLDDSVKTVQIDESKKVGDLMFYICNKIGIANHEEYGLCDTEEQQMEEAKTGTLSRPATGTLTLKRGAPREKDAELQHLIKKFKTDNNVEWLDQHKTLRELRIDPKKTLLLKRRLFYSDRNVDSRDPLQLNLLYVQTRDAILDGAHVVTEDKAVEFAGLQCQIQYGDYQEEKHKPGFIENLKEFLPADFTGSWGVEKKIYREHRKHAGLSPLDAKQLYVKLARSLPTYGVTFFVVKEKQKGKKKLVPRLLGINAESILRLDEQTKEILQTWLLTQVKTYKASTETFTLNFGDYSDKEYAVKTNESYRIKDILEGYIDIIRRRLAAPTTTEYVEGELIIEDNVTPSKGSTITNYSAKKIETHSLVGPSQIVAVEQGHNVGKGTNVTTVHQIITTMGAGQHQHGVGSLNHRFVEELSDATGRAQFGKKLNFLNSESVKAVVLLSEPSQANIQSVREIAQSMDDVLPDIIKGVKENAAKRDEAESRKILADLDELYSFITKLSQAVKDCDPNDEEKLMAAQNAAKKIADLSTQIYFSCDPKSNGRKQLLQTSRKSFIEDEKTVAALRRASFITATDGARQAVQDAQEELYEEYNGPMPHEHDIERIENDATHKLGKLNAAVAHLLIAHADPDNVDYEMAVNSMKTVNEYTPQLINDAKALGSAESEPHRNELLDKIQKLLDEMNNLCSLIGTNDTNKMQEAGNQYANTSKKLMFTFGKRKPSPKVDDKCGEIKDLVMAVGDATQQLLSKVQELGAEGDDPDFERVDICASKVADAAQALLSCAELTSQSISEPHCQSALTAAIENLASSSQSMSAAWKPMVEKPGNSIYGTQLVDLSLKLAKVLDSLKDSYSNLNGLIEDDIGMTDVEPLNDDKRRLKFIASVSHLKKDIDDASRKLDKPNEPTISGAPVVSVKRLNRRLADKLAELNASIANLLQATADPENHDLVLAQSSIDNIRQLTAEISDEARLLNGNINPVAWSGLKAELSTMFDAVNDICANAAEYDGEGLNDAVSKYGKASSKLVKTCHPESYVAPNSIVELSKKACDETSQMLIKVNDLAEKVDVEDGNVLDEAGAKLADTAQATLRTAELTAPTMSNSHCRQSMICALDSHAAVSKDLNNTWQDVFVKQPDAPMKEDLQNNYDRLQDLLNDIREICSKEIGDPENEAQKEKQRLKFLASLSNAKNAIGDATKDLENEIIEDYGHEDNMNVQVIRRGLADKLAQLNAALASLVQASSDPSNPDTESAKVASENIHKVVPDIVEAIKRLRGSMDDKEYKAITEDLKTMLEAAQDVCDHDGKDLQEAVSKLSKSSRRLIFTFKPVVKSKKEKQVQDLANSASEQTAAMLSKVNQLAESVGGDLGQELDIVGAQVADAAKALITTAKITGPSINDAECKQSLASAVNTQSALVKDLDNTLQPVVQNPKFKHYMDDLLSDSQGIQNTLDKLRNLCQADEGEADGILKLSDTIIDPKQRLVFTTAVSVAKNAVENAQKDLENIEKSAPSNLRENVQERKLRLKDKLARLNAAMASLVDASADPSNPDIMQAENAIEAIRKIAPDLIEDAKALHGNVDGRTWQAIVKNLKSALEATDDLCGSQNTENINDVLNKFSAATGNLSHVLDPKASTDSEKKLLDLSRQACESTSVMLSKVYELAGEVKDEDAQLLDNAGARVANAAQALLNVAEISAPSINDPKCQASVSSAVDREILLANNLNDVWKPIVQTPQHSKHKDGLQYSSQAVQNTLGKLKELCHELGKDSELEAKQQMLQNGILSAKSVVEDALKTLEDTKGHRPAPDANVRQRKRALADKLAKLNAALASLMQATADESNPNVEQAADAIETIQKLAPEVVHDVKCLDGQVDENFMRAITGDLKVLLQATSDMCNKAENKNINEIVQKLGRSSSRMMNMVNTKTNVKKEKEISDLARAACEQTSSMLVKVSPLAESVGGEEGQALDQAGARLVDAAQLLFSTSILTAPSIKDVNCSNALIAAANNQSSLIKELEDTWKPILAKSENRRHKDGLDREAAMIQNTLDRLKELLHDEQNQQILSNPELEVSQAKENIVKSEALLNEKLKKMPKSDPSRTNGQAIDDPKTAPQRLLLMKKLAQLNDAMAQLVEAYKISDDEELDHKTAQEAITKLGNLTQDVVKDIIALEEKADGDCSQLLEEARELCKASENLCSRVEDNDVDGINKAAMDYAGHAHKLRFMFSPQTNPAQINQILESSKSICERTSLMLSRVSRLADLVDPATSNKLHISGAAVGDTAQKLLTTAQITASSINDESCKSRLISSADRLLASSQEMGKVWKPLVQNEVCYPIGQQLYKDQDCIQIGINQLKTACEKTAGPEIPKQKPVIPERLVIEDCPLKQMARKILSTVQGKSKSANISPQEQALYADFCNKLEDAIKTFDTANAKCRNQPTDANRRRDLESAIMKLQQMCLFSKDPGGEESYIVDLTNYVSNVTSAAEDVVKSSSKVTPFTTDVKKVKDESQKIVNEADNSLKAFDVESAEITDDMLKYDLFGKSCEDRVKVMTEAAFEIPDSKRKIELQEKIQNLAENIDLLRFASKCNLSSAMGISVDETLDNLTDIEKHIEDIITSISGIAEGREGDAKEMIVDAQEALVSSLVSSDNIPKAFAEYALQMRSAVQPDDRYKRKLKDHLKRLADLLKSQVAVRGRMVNTWQDIDGPETTAITDKIIQELDSFNTLDGDTKPEDSLAASNEFKNLLMAKSNRISGNNEDLLEKFRKQVNKVSIDANTLVLSCHQPDSLGRCLNLVSESAAAAAATARSIRTENPMTEKQIQDAAQNMCKATYRTVKVAQSLQRTENKADARRRLQDACKQLNEAINRLVRTVSAGGKERGDDEVSRNLHMQGAFLRARLPSNTLGYRDCLEALQNQHDIIQKLGSNEKMTKAERTESLNYITSAICNATEYATQTAYLLSLSKHDRNVIEHGLADVNRLKKITANLRAECMKMLYCGDAEQIKHIKSEISKQADALQKGLEDDNEKIQETLRPVLSEDMKMLQAAVNELQNTIDSNDNNNMGSRIKGICKVIDGSNRINASIEKIIEPQVSNQSQGSSQDIIDNTRDLVTKTSALIKKASSSDDDVMTWVVFGGPDVMKTFDKLVQCVRQKGVDADLIASAKQEEGPLKSYIETQIDLAKKWLQRPASKPEVKEAGIKAINYTIEIADKVTEDLNEPEKEDMKQVVAESKQLLAECTQKYNSEKASLLLERLKELRKMLERGVVTRVVEDFLHDDHLLDMETMVAKEKDASRRKFILERKLAELQAQLGKVAQTGRLVADTGCLQSRRDLLDTTHKVELLAPSLVKATQERLESPEDKEAVEKYMLLVEQYAQMIASMRDLCDSAVDPIDFVQAAGETMQRIKEDASNDPNTGKITSRMILRLGNRVVDAGMNSAERQKDPEMQTTLTIIKKTIELPKADAQETQDDWKAIFAEILKKTSQVESVLGGEGIFNREPEPDQPIFAAALDLHAAVREWSARDNDIVGLAKRMAVLMAKLSRSMETDDTRSLLSTSKEIVSGAEEVAALARKLALECTDMRIRTNLLQVCDKIPTIGGQLKILTTVKGSSLGHQGSFEDQEAMNMLVCNAQNLMKSIQEVVAAAASASVKINSQRGRRIKWVRRRNYY
ncbi:talin-2-like isoform X2 [Aricia agestis]|uniref:talin-2-like isoform X2 n=1 Tax=Aricia agestis TaxID=91739 RepID=UPI001C202E9A|nr:talin-2-like isoform X2 [Aricia agestis]